MFLHNLTRAQKLTFVELARELIASDHRLTEEEEGTLAKLAAEMGVPSDLKRRANRSALATTFDSRRSRITLLIDLLTIGFADHAALASEENEFLTEIATLLGIDQAELQRLENWVARHTALMHEAEALFGE